MGSVMAACLAAVMLSAAPAQTLVAPQRQSNAEVRAMFEADQAARQDISKIVPVELYNADFERRKRMRALLDAGQLGTGDDFYRAAFIFSTAASRATICSLTRWQSPPSLRAGEMLNG